MASNTPSRIGAHLPLEGPDGVARRSVLLLGGAGAAGLLGARVTGQLAHAAPHPTRTPAPPGIGLPTPPPPPAAGASPREPWSSGALGSWPDSRHEHSHPDEAALAVANEGVHLVGDSVAMRLLPAFRARLEGRPLSYDVWNGRPVTPGLDSLARAAQENRLAQTVVVVLGSNDIFDPWGFEGQVRRCTEITGARRVLWVTPYVSRPAAPSADLRNTALIGLVLERAAATGSIELVRWFELIARVSERLDDYLDDGVHPTKIGAAALADLVLSVLRRSEN